MSGRTESTAPQQEEAIKIAAGRAMTGKKSRASAGLDCSFSRKGFQVVRMDPAVLAIVQFHSIPVRSHDHDDDFRIRRERRDTGGGVKGRAFKFHSRRFNPAFYLVAQDIYLVFQILGRRLSSR